MLFGIGIGLYDMRGILGASGILVFILSSYFVLFRYNSRITLLGVALIPINGLHNF